MNRNAIESHSHWTHFVLAFSHWSPSMDPITD